MSLNIYPPTILFNDIDGQPLEDGYIYVGVAGLNPEASPIANVYSDSALSVPVAQPIRTLGGRPVNASGAPIMLFVPESDFSVTIRNKNATLIETDLNFRRRFPSSLVTFLSSGTGAVDVSLYDRLNFTVFVTDYGATGDGVTDDTAAINLALATGKPVCFPPGSYVTSSALLVQADQEVWGYGSDSKILHGANSNCLFVDTKANVYIHDLFVQGTNVFGTSEILLRVGDLSENVTIQRVTFYQGGRNGISVQQNSPGNNPKDINVIECRFVSNQGNGLFFNGVNGGSVTDCYFGDNGQSEGDASNVGYGLVIDTYWENTPKDISVIGNTFERNTQGGVIVLSGVGITITGNTFRDTGSAAFVDPGMAYGNGIYVRWKGPDGNLPGYTEANNINITGNTLVRCYGYGIKVENGNNYTISGNTISNSGYLNVTWVGNGIYLTNTGSNVLKYFTVSNNTIQQVTVGEHNYGIYLEGCQYGAVMGNQINDVTLAGIYSKGDAGVFNYNLDICGNQIIDANVMPDGIKLEYTQRSTIANNNIYNPLTYGINGDANTIDNRVSDNYTLGVTAGNEVNLTAPLDNEWAQDFMRNSLYDFADQGGTQGHKVIGCIPDNCYIVEAWYEVLTAMTSGGAATVEIGIITDDTTAIAANAAYNHASFAAGLHDGVPDGTVANFSTKTTAIRSVTLRIQTADLTAGKIRVWWRYVMSE